MKANLIKYEIKNVLGNIFVPIFSIALPIFLGILIPISIKKEIPPQYMLQVITTVILNISIIITLCIALIGHNASVAIEIEKKVPLRLNLFGISKRDVLVSKIASELIIMIIAFVLYFLIVGNFHKIASPNIVGALKFFTIILAISIIFITISHGIADIIGKFGPSYGLIMTLYFLLLFISGAMGMQYKDFPVWLKRISDLTPLSNLNNIAYSIWTNQSVNYAPLIQSLVFFFAIGVILNVVAYYKQNKARI